MALPVGTAGPAAIAGTASSAQAAVPPDCLVAVTVPSVIGMTELSAGQVLQTAGFSVDIFAEMPAGQSVPTGEVWSQTPAAGRRGASRHSDNDRCRLAAKQPRLTGESS